MTNRTALIAELEKATEGSRELDYRVARLLGWTYEKMKGDSKPYWRKPGEKHYYMRTLPPDYTTSLDAKLPGESIIEVRLRFGGMWSAVNLGFAGAVGHTEPLARRIAALKAMEEGK